MSNRSSRRRILWYGVPFAMAGVALLAAACSRDMDPTTPVGVRVAPDAVQALSAGDRGRLQALKARTHWAGDSHHEAMQVVIASVVEHRKARRPLPKAGSAEHCAILERAGSAALRVLDRHRGISRSDAGRLALVRRDQDLTACGRGMTVFGAPAAGLLAASVATEYDPEVTGAYEAYLDPMDAVVQASGGSAGTIASGLDAVLAQAIADGVPEGDLLALSSFAGVAVSSAHEWNAFDWAGLGGGDGSCTQTESGCYSAEMSVFAVDDWDSRPIKVIAADAAACFSTVKGWGALKALLVGPAWSALAAECGLRAAVGSGGALIAMI